MRQLLPLLSALLLCSCRTTHYGDLIAVCGDAQVLILDTRSKAADAPAIWRWHADEARGQMPDAAVRMFYTIDECKPIDNGRRLLLTASSGGTMLLNGKTRRVEFFAATPMAHSACLLPGGRVAVALSTHKQGNALEVYDLKRSNERLFRDTLRFAHGVVWRNDTRRLYALGYDTLRAYSLQNWDTPSPSLRLEEAWKVPLQACHDLSDKGDGTLIITGQQGVQTFNTHTATFAPFEPLAKTSKIKSVNYDPRSKRLIYTRAEQNWWTFHIYQRQPERTFTIDSIHLYKVRPLSLPRPARK